jgi:hypothetical protein
MDVHAALVTNERWEGDEVGAGISSGEAFAPPLRALLEEMSREDWNTEDPEAHLLPHLERELTRSPLALVATRVDDGVLVLELEAGSASRADARSAVYALVASIAEPTTTIVEREGGDARVFDVALAIVPWQTDVFPKGHGHLIRFRLASS